MSIITLTTDFGTNDWFVGTMKGVILRINPRATVVDFTHGIPSGDIRAGAFALAAGCRFFPRGTVHVVVVDPGVGSDRGAIGVQTADYFFVGPDNGVLSLALAQEKIRTIRRLTSESFFLQPISHTFHGRDIFAPAAAHLSNGVRCGSFGPALKDYHRLPWPYPRKHRGTIHGEIVYVDQFGNAITNIGNQSFSRSRANLAISVREKRICPLKTFYQAVPPGKPVAVPGSTGFLEIAINGGNAARGLKLKIGDTVIVRPA